MITGEEGMKTGEGGAMASSLNLRNYFLAEEMLDLGMDLTRSTKVLQQSKAQLKGLIDSPC